MPPSPGPRLANRAQDHARRQGRAMGLSCGGGCSGSGVGRAVLRRFVEHDRDEPADRHAEARCLLFDNGELFEQRIALARGNFSKTAITCRAVAKESVRDPLSLNEAAISVDRYATPQRPFLQQFLDGGGVQIGHYVL